MSEARINRREMLGWLARGGAFLGTAGLMAGAEGAAGAKYPSDKVLRGLAKDGWVVEYTREDVRREGAGLRGPSIVPPEKFVCTPVLLESQFTLRGRCILVMPRYAHVCDQTCLATRVEVEADGKALHKGTDYALKPLVTGQLRNRFWRFDFTLKEEGPVKVRVYGLVSNPEAPADLATAKSRIAELARKPNRFAKRYRVPTFPHWLKDPSSELKEAAAEVRGKGEGDGFDTLLDILKACHKKGHLTKGMSRDPEKFVKDGMKGSCGANADFVNFAAHAAGVNSLIYTEGYVVVPPLNYMGLHVWNTACFNGFFIADSLNPELYFPQYAGYVATAVGPNPGHPAGANGSTSGGWINAEYYNHYYIYFSTPGYGTRGKELARMEIPEAVRQLAAFAERQRARVNRR